MGCLGQKSNETDSQKSEEKLIEKYNSQPEISEDSREINPALNGQIERNNNNPFLGLTMKSTIYVNNKEPENQHPKSKFQNNEDQGITISQPGNEGGDNIQIYDKIKTINEEEEDNYAFLVKNSKTLCEYSYKKVDISDKNSEAAQRIFKEVEILKKIEHPNIIKFFEATISKDNKYIEVLTELPEDGDLQMKLDEYECDYKCFQENELLDWLSQMCFALKYIHNLNILHRNIKPSSIFLMNRGYAKLGDFGMAKIVTKGGDLKRVKTFMPKGQFTAPEIFEKKDFTEKTDIWFLGVTFFQLMTFKFPFKGDNDKEKMKSILNEDKNDFNFSYNNDFKDLITRMISKDPNKRPTPDEILEMPFIRKRLESYVDENENEFLKVQDDLFGQLQEIESGSENDKNEVQKEIIPLEKKLVEGINQDNNKKRIKEDKKIDNKSENKEIIINDRQEYDKDDNSLDKINKNNKRRVRFNYNAEEIKKKNENNKKKKAKKSAMDFIKQLKTIKELIKK